MFNPSEAAHANPYFKRNHLGKVTCTLCNICCNDENCFNRHIEGKTHSLRLRTIMRSALRRKRIEEDEKEYARAEAEAAKERAVRELAGNSGNSRAGNKAGGGSSSGVNSLCHERNMGALVQGKFGIPAYTFRTEHDTSLTRRATKVWLEFFFPQAEEGTRPLHRWRSAREQQMEEVIDEYFIFLLVACEGYTTVALKFPSSAVHLNEWEAQVLSGQGFANSRAHHPYRRPGRNNMQMHNSHSQHFRHRYNNNNNMSLDKRRRDEDDHCNNNNSNYNAVSQADGGIVRSYEYSWDSIRKVYSIYMLLTC